MGLPFSAEAGNAVASATAFVVGALAPSGKTVSAVALVLSPGVGSSKIDLGAVHGDVLPPRVAVQGSAMVSAVPDGAPNGTLVRLARVDDVTAPGASPHWGADITEGRDESDALSLELGDKLGVLAWDDWSSREAHGEIRAVTFAASDVSKISPVSVLSAKTEDAEEPAIVRRPGGFWLAYVVNVKREPDKGSRGRPSDEQTPVDLGPRYVAIMPLDDAGKPSGAALPASPKDGHVTGFDLATATGGAVLLAYRDDAASNATAGGTVHLVVVRPGGSLEPRTLGDDESTVGAPSLLSDAASDDSVNAWLALTNEADATRLLALDGAGLPLDALGVDGAIGRAAPLVVRKGRMLVARPRGTALEFELYACTKGERPM